MNLRRQAFPRFAFAALVAVFGAIDACGKLATDGPGAGAAEAGAESGAIAEETSASDGTAGTVGSGRDGPGEADGSDRDGPSEADGSDRDGPGEAEGSDRDGPATEADGQDCSAPPAVQDSAPPFDGNDIGCFGSDPAHGMPGCDGGTYPVTCCHGACVDTSSDTNNCGSCGNSCSCGAVCTHGACVP